MYGSQVRAYQRRIRLSAMNIRHITTTKKLMTAILVIVLGSLSLTGASQPAPMEERGGLCCLCECHSADESKCARVCVKMQHGTKIIEEPEMKACTKSCLRHGVKQFFFTDDWK